MSDTTEALTADIKAAVTELADGRKFPDLIDAIDRLAALAQQAATPTEPFVEVTCREVCAARQAATPAPAEPVARTPAAQWRESGEPDPHGNRYDCERAQLAMGNLSDDELANGAFMNYDQWPTPQQMIAGTHKPPIAWMTAVKDRIRWLSRSLEKALAAPPATPAAQPAEPPPGLLMSMAIRYDHGLGMPGYYDTLPLLTPGLTHAKRLEATLRQMRQLWEEVTGRGFYRPEKEAEYAALAAAPAAPSTAQEAG